jgi:hypothetical protein
MRRFPSAAAAAAAALSVLAPRAYAVEPWADPDPAAPPERKALGDDYGVRARAEYRIQHTRITPLDLASERDAKFTSFDQRLRVDGTLDFRDRIRLTTSIDVLDGVLWGDNGTLGSSPEPDSGGNINSRNVNFARICFEPRAGGNTVDPKGWSYGLCEANPFFIRRLFVDVVTPVGLLRVGRQAFNEGLALLGSDGDGRRNRFGVANRGNNADRILFATKPLEALKPKDQRDTSEKTGLVVLGGYDRIVGDDPMALGDDVHQVFTAARYAEPQLGDFRNVEGRFFGAWRFNDRFGSRIGSYGARLSGTLGDFTAGAEGALVLGRTRELSEAFSVLTNDPPVSQEVAQVGARTVVRWDRPWLTLYLEGDYASGDSDPRSRTPLTQFRFAEDANVGLLLFKHIYAYQTGRVAAAATELLKNLNAPIIPVEALATRGAMTNAAVIFPQIDVRPSEEWLLRAGVLMAWAPSTVNDPVASVQRQDLFAVPGGLLNYAGGLGGRYYGTEIDGRVQYRWEEHAIVDLEGAVLFPGSALRDRNGDAVTSYLLQARSTFLF